MARWQVLFHVGIFFIYCPTLCEGVYLTSTYAMDASVSRTFGGYCGETIRDDCLWITSGLNVFGLSNYGNNVDCIITLDASINAGNRYMLRVEKWVVQSSTNCSSDYLEIYDWYYNSSVPTQNAQHLVGRYCGISPNLTGIPTGRAVSFKFHTDGSQVFSGFKLIAIRTTPVPCESSEFECEQDSVCINAGLKCDGTPQCSNGTDELGCTGWDNFLGSILRLGLVDMIAIGVIVVGSIIFFGVIGCILCCCCCGKKKRTNVSPDQTTPIVVNVIAGDPNKANEPVVATVNETEHGEAKDNNIKADDNQTPINSTQTTGDDMNDVDETTKADGDKAKSDDDGDNVHDIAEVGEETQKEDNETTPIDSNAAVAMEEDKINSDVEHALQTENDDDETQPNEETKADGDAIQDEEVKQNEDIKSDEEIKPNEDTKPDEDQNKDEEVKQNEDIRSEEEIKQNEDTKPDEQTTSEDNITKEQEKLNPMDEITKDQDNTKQMEPTNEDASTGADVETADSSNKTLETIKHQAEAGGGMPNVE
ncbi:unnamed protein product [Owenia fusiformis]|uniref:Uncharacterized protein n=1 Tax=Owenia fusiformis TaxID=6347 RepID=A0A8J1TTP0_OWEFU|nr:unnamed protein product [Owenia fusiformis]